VDTPLIGYWSGRAVHPSDPEYSDLGFRADGSGWSYWSSWSTEFVVQRFRRHVPAPGVLAARLHLTVGGTRFLPDDEGGTDPTLAES